MLEFLRNLFGRRDTFGYTPGEREIFRYHDGLRRRQGDPLALHRALLDSKEFDINFDPGIAAVPTAEGLRAAGRIAAAARKVFGVPAFESGGLTEWQCIELFTAFGQFVKGIREDAGPLASSPGPTPATGSDAYPTAPFADSGLTETAPAATAP